MPLLSFLHNSYWLKGKNFPTGIALNDFLKMKPSLNAGSQTPKSGNST